ncbi:MAG: hypothetical protein ABI618_06590 [Nitrospirota bacterium]
MKGGKRPGAGRKKGIPNRASAAREAAITASGLTPLDYMLSTMRDETKPLALRLDMAKAAAPYVHPRLASVEQAVQVDAPQPMSITINFVEPDGTRVKSLPL